MRVSWSQLITYAKEGKITGQVEVTETQAIAKLKPGSVPGVTDDKSATPLTVALDPRAMDTYIAELRKENIDFVSNVGSSMVGNLLLTIIGPVLLFGALAVPFLAWTGLASYLARRAKRQTRAVA